MKTKIDIYVIEQVKRRCTELGMSQAALADYLEMSHGFIGEAENPRQPAKYNIRHLNLLALILDCSPQSFLPTLPLQ